jgi:hypothetical protein
MQNQEISRHTLYRNFKGNLYYVIGEAREVTDGKYEEVVVYHALYGDNEMFTRTKEDFLADVSDHPKNVTGQKYRFEVFQD